jgi:sugar (pentulose or hexulose) kinase
LEDLVAQSILAGVAVGVWPDVHAGVEATLRLRSTVEPVAEWVTLYRERRERFRELYSALRGRH